MEKMMYLLWKDQQQSRSAFAESLLGEASARLLELEPRGLQLNVVDDSVRPAEHMLQINSRPRPYAVVSLWVDSANDREPFASLLEGFGSRVAGYLVTESAPMPETDPPAPGKSSRGFSHVVLFQKPPRLSRPDWLRTWLGSHTQLAIDTQSTFMYYQNVVAWPFDYTAPDYDAIVEEGFPEAAMVSWEAFYDATGNPEKLERNRRAMMESCERFIDFDRLEAFSTRRYVFRHPG